MSKLTVNAKEVMHDIRAGVDNAALMEKYRLTETGLRSLMTKLVEAKLLERSEVEARLRGMHPAAAESWVCPSCNHTQLEKPPVCPMCGTITDKHAKQQPVRAAKHAVPESKPEPEQPSPEAALHGRESDTRQCPHCSRQVRADAAKCKYCGNSLKPGPEDADGDLVTEYCPWEDGETFGTFEALKETATSVLFNPFQFFARLPASGELKKPLAFGLIFGCTGFVLFQIWTILLQPGKGWYLLPLLWAILSPIIVAVFLFVWASVAHVCLAMMGEANAQFEATFKVCCYALAPQVLQVVPVLGTFVASVWTAVAAVIGLQEVHATTTGKAVVAVLLPSLVVCGIALVAAWLIGFAGFLSTLVQSG